jgi:protein HIRA/HIR1
MVRAEVPLWVVHTNEAPAASNNNNNNNKDPQDAADPKNAAADQEALKKSKAKGSLTLLEGLSGTQKCAIYSIDVHPKGKKFATGGGDGTVKIWNTDALFSGSSSSSTSSSPSQQKRSSKFTVGPPIAYESSGESEQDESNADGDDVSGDTSRGDASDSPSEEEEEAVHDLSSVVRKKKDGTPGSAVKPTNEAATTTTATGTTTTTTAATTPSSPSHHQPPKQHHNQHHEHRLLCTLSAHTGSSVLAVRFSTSGQYLASAGDDAMVCIYTLDQNLTNGNLEHSSSSSHHHHQHVEHWTRIKLCRGHGLDAVGLAWAPDDSHLVSCSLDSNTPIIVWKVTDLATAHKPTHSNVLCNPYKILGKGLHTSTVKGVTFDPAGTYLASSGDDPSVCVWRAHDDWGLERRIDASSGIFRRWKDNDSQALSSQSLFRRLSWSTDGAYICSTNAVVKNKHVASTIAREGWAVSSAKSTASGAANLVGHKQPVVACRHCPFLLDARQDGDDESGDGDEPEYATLLALGDKRGFVTVWSTRKSRPVFKIQCSETRCTVTDLAWGRADNNDITLIISLLDGQVVALRFGVPDELGNVLKASEQARVFQLRYGIDLGDTTFGQRRLFVGENSGPKLIENALQYTLEDRDEDDDDDANMGNDDSSNDNGDSTKMTSADVRANQLVSRSKGGKKRVQPLLMSVGGGKKRKLAPSPEKAPKKKIDTVEGAMELAEKAASGAEAAVTQQTNNKAQSEPVVGESTAAQGQREIAPQPPQNHQGHIVVGSHSMPQIPHSTDRIHSVDLTSGEGNLVDAEAKLVADCTNSIQVPPGSSGSALPCAILSISRGGQSIWKDHIVGTSCSAVSASKNVLAVGMADGSVQLYGTSPTNGWTSGVGFRSHPPFILGRPIVTLQLRDVPPTDQLTTEQTELLVVSSDGSFGVYTLIPELKIRFKGTLMPPMSHMMLSSDSSAEVHLPRLARIQLTENNRLLLLLSYHSSHGRTGGEDTVDRGNNTPSVGAGGSLQAFLYNDMSELWMRVADSRFVLSDFYSTLPTKSKSKKGASGELSKLDDTVRMGATSSTLKASRRGRAYLGGHADASYGQTRDDGHNDVATRSHCEDRMACALALGSAGEFEFWLSMYVRTIAMSGIESLLRLVVDMLLGRDKEGAMEVEGGDCGLSWWLSQAPLVLGLNRVKLVQSIVIPEMSKNRALQRITNEIAIEVEAVKPTANS